MNYPVVVGSSPTFGTKTFSRFPKFFDSPVMSNTFFTWITYIRSNVSEITLLDVGVAFVGCICDNSER